MLSGAVALRSLPDGLLQAFQASATAASALEKSRAFLGSQPLVTTKLTDRLSLLTGPGGNVLAFHGPNGKIIVDGFVKPAWPKLKAALDALDGGPIHSMIDTHWHYDHADNSYRVTIRAARRAK